MHLITFSLLCLVATALFACEGGALHPREVSFKTEDGGEVFALVQGTGDQGVVLSHGKIFNKESWEPFASDLAKRGFRVLAVDFRGYGKSTPGSEKDALHLDLLAAVRYLRGHGAKTVSLIGGSMGGGAAAQAAVMAAPGEIDKVILLSPMAIERPDEMKAIGFLYVVSEGEAILSMVKDQFARAPEPKGIEVLAGSAHAQHLFKTDQAERLKELIIAFLSK